MTDHEGKATDGICHEGVYWIDYDGVDCIKHGGRDTDDEDWNRS